ncbi:MAG: TonB-dependent receptor [Pseudomonadota bacterium]
MQAIQRGVALAALLGTSAAMAQETAPEAPPETLILDELLISAGRTPVGVDETGRAFTVITGEQLEAQGVRYVAEALRRVPGVAVSRTGSVGGLTQVRLRGAEGNQVLVLIDGLEVSSIAQGEFDFGSLQVAGIERIEVLRGPQSALYGSNASAGVISIITKRGARGGTDWSGTIEGGTDGTALVQGTVSGGGTNWNGSLTASFRRTAGFNVATGTDDAESERDGDRNFTLTGRASVDVTEDLRFGGTFFLRDRESEFDSQLFPFPADATSGLVVDSNSVNEARDIALGLFGRYEMLDDALVHELRFEVTDTRSENVIDDVPGFTSEGRRYKGVVQSSYAFDIGTIENLATAAVEIEEEINQASTGDQTRTLIGLVGEYRVSPLDGLDLQAGLRYDFNDAFEDALTYSVGASYAIAGTGTRLHASVGRGVVNPSFSEQFGFSPGRFIGNPDLDPERTFQWDIGVEQSLFDGRVVFDATYFRGRVTDEIISGFDTAASLPTSVNATGESPRQGVELALTLLPIDALSLTASYTYTLSEEGSTGFQEVRRPRHTAGLDALYRFAGDRATLGLGLTYSGDQRDLDFTAGTFPAPLITLDSYVLLNIQGSYEVTENLAVFARVENATNTDYQEVFNFETQGIAGFAGLRVNF